LNAEEESVMGARMDGELPEHEKWPDRREGTEGEAGVKPTHTNVTPEEEEVMQAIAEEGPGFVFDVVHAFGRTRLERRVSRNIHRVRWALEFAWWDLTPAEKQALAITYGCAMPNAEAARRLRIPRQQYRDRLRRAEDRVDRLYDARNKPRLRAKTGRPNAKIPAPEGALWMAARARERLGVGSGFVWGSGEPPYAADQRAEALQIIADELMRDGADEMSRLALERVRELSRSHKG
jgi:hypothetical protein